MFDDKGIQGFLLESEGKVWFEQSQSENVEHAGI